MSDLNTIIQFFAAIYVTISLDNVLLRRFWSPDLYGIAKKALSKFDFALSTPLRESLIEDIKKSASRVDCQSRQRGCFVLINCIYLLIYIAFETHLTVNYDEVIYKAYYIQLCSMVATIIGSIGIYIYGVFRWNQWRGVVKSSFLVVGLYILIHIISNVIWQKAWTSTIHIYNNRLILLIKIFVLLCVSLPIIIRLTLNWIYSEVFINSLTESLTIENDKYVKTRKGIEEKDSRLCDPDYSSVITTLFVQNFHNADLQDSEFKKALVDRLIVACKFKPSWELLRYYLKHRKDMDNTIGTEITNQLNHITEYALPQNDADLESLCIEYASIQDMSIADFCKMKNIAVSQFKRYRKDKFKRKK
jgi:hypothetical protein